MKKVKFDVVTIYEHYEDDEQVQVRIERTKTFEEADYQQAMDYYEKRRAAFGLMYTTDEAYYTEEDVDGRKFRGEHVEFAMPGDGWLTLEVQVRVTNN